MRGRVHDQSFTTDGARWAWPYWGWRLCGLLLVLLATVSSAPAAGAPQHTWRTVAELTEAEQALFDTRTDTPRDSQYPYLPAERSPNQRGVSVDLETL